MGTVFLSHSSVDKRFVRRLALDLLQRGFAVWLDEWNLRPGARLSDRIAAAVTSSSVVIVVMSEAMRSSEWVDREIEHALDMEAAQHREVLLPIRIDAAALPDRLTDRVYADFSAGSYQDPFEKLCAQLDRDLGDDHGASSPELELIPLFVSDGSVLDAHRLDARVAQLAHRYGPGYRITTAQLQLSEEPDYDALRSRVTARLDHPEADPFYSPDFAVQLRSDYDSVSRRERTIVPTLTALINHRGLGGAHPYAWEAYSWYWRRARTHVIAYYYRMQNPESELPPFGRAHMYAEFNPDVIATLYGVESTTGMAIGDLASGHEYSFEADSECPPVKFFRGPPFVGGLVPVGDGGVDFVDRWVLPQVLWRSTDFDDWDSVDAGRIGLR
jgi:TIR domain